eukprot:4184341-Karenia_brevis.AAC.1
MQELGLQGFKHHTPTQDPSEFADVGILFRLFWTMVQNPKYRARFTEVPQTYAKYSDFHRTYAKKFLQKCRPA